MLILFTEEQNRINNEQYKTIQRTTHNKPNTKRHWFSNNLSGSHRA